MTREEVEHAYDTSWDIEDAHHYLSKDTYIDLITKIINFMENEELNIKEALEVLDGAKEIVLWSKIK